MTKERVYTKEENEFYRGRMLADYDRLIEEFAQACEVEGRSLFVTAMDGRLINAALRQARRLSKAVTR